MSLPGGQIRLEELELLMTRETVRDPPQYHIMRLGGSNGAGPALRRLSDYPHPYPALRDLQKEVIRCACLLHSPALTPACVHGTFDFPRIPTLPCATCRRRSPGAGLLCYATSFPGVHGPSRSPPCSPCHVFWARAACLGSSMAMLCS
jgi:hypothetical protein